MTQLEGVEARLIALEMLFRGMLAGIVSTRFDPIGEVDRMAEEFRSSSGFLSFEGASDDYIEQMRALVMARVDDNFNAVRCRAMRDVEAQAAKSGKRN